MKYSFLMPYFKRVKQLHNTLASFVHHYAGKRADYEIILLEDVKNVRDEQDHEQFTEIVRAFSSLMNIVPVKTDYENCHNPAPLFNLGAITMAKGKFLIITNPECFHKADVLSGLDEEFAKDESSYVVCSCASIVSYNFWIKDFFEFKYSHHRWYQHSEYRNAMYHFCSAISKENYTKVGGFDESYRDGIGYEDNDFIETIKKAKIPIVTRDDLLVLHMQHEKLYHMKGGSRKALVQRNKRFFEAKWGVTV